MSENSNVLITSNRIEWIDIFKCICIILMVIGHATGKFNGFIYQFHMTAFFFVSGFVSKLQKKSISEVVVSKILTLYLPLLFFVILGSFLLLVLKQWNLHEVIFPSPLQYRGFIGNITLFLTNGLINIQFLGACWFIGILFLVAINSKVLYDYINNRIALIICSFILMLCGYKISNHIISLVFVSQFYYILGFLISTIEIQNKFHSFIKKYLTLVILLINIALLFFFKKKRLSINLDIRHFNNPVIDILMQMNGISFVYICSFWISKVKLSKIKKILTYIGKNTLPIVFFHFIGFKLLLIYFHFKSVISIEDVGMVVPSADISNQYWLIFTIFSIVFSLFCWFLLCKIPIINTLIGKNVTQLNTLLNSLLIVKTLNELYIKIISVYQFWKISKSSDFNLFSIIRKIIVFFIIIGFFVCTKFVPNIHLVNEGPVDICFPSTDSTCVFNKGWLPQSDTENYRCIQKESEFYAYVSNQKFIEVQGYIPENFTMINKINVKINGLDVYQQNIKPGDALLIKLDISDYQKKRILVSINFNDERIPTESDNDKRIFSALISKISLF